MIVLSAGNVVDPRTITQREPGFSQKVDRPTKAFSFSVTLDELRPGFFNLADIFIAECPIDDQQYGTVDIPEIQVLGYPDLQTLAERWPDVAAWLIREYLWQELLEHLFPYNPGCLERVINNLFTSELNGDVLTVTGETFDAVKPRQ